MKTKLLLMLLVAATLSVSAVAGSIKVLNAGFEDNVLADGDSTEFTNAWLDGWYDVGSGFWYYYEAWVGGTENPDTGMFAGGVAPEGQNVAVCANYAAYDMGLAQILEHNLIQGAKYTLTAKVGNPLYNEDDGLGATVGNYRIEVLDADGAILNGPHGTSGPPPAAGTWINVTTGEFSGKGQRAWDMPIEIRIMQEDYVGNDTYSHWLAYDVITLSHDQPSIIIETPDMITWDGQGVDLAASADGVTTQTWTADPPAGVVFSHGSISPPETALDPTVTVTLPVVDLVTSAHIVNADFEDDAYGDGGWAEFPTSGDGWLRMDNWQVGAWNVTALDFREEAKQGQNIGYVDCYNEGGVEGMKQVLDDPLMADVEYTLTVQVGNMGRNTGWAGYHVQLLAGGVIIAEDEDSINRITPIDPNAWVMSTVIYPATEFPEQVGELLEIRLETLGEYTGSGEDSPVSIICYDDVHLTSNVAAFQRADAYPVTLTVTGDSGAQPVSLKLDVYKTPCKATIAAGLQTPADFDQSCAADVPDLATVLKTWQDHNALTAPKAKPQAAQAGGEREIAINNAGFEIPALADGDWAGDAFVGQDPTLNWNEISPVTGAWNTGADYYEGILPEGENFLWLAGGAEIQQILSENLLAYTNYTLALQVGHNPFYDSDTYTVEFLAGGTSIASFSEEVDEIESDKFELRTLNYTYDPANAALIGQPLEIRMALANPGAGNNIEVNFDDVKLYADSGMDPSPANNAYAHPANPLTLSWTNRAANVGTDVWVDVWFGTDPDPKNGTQVVTAGLNAASTTVDASTVDTTYYWQVDSYLEGSPPTGTPVAGSIWEFQTVTDIPVTVEFDNNWVTWSGRAVQLASGKVDDTVSTVDYAWIVDPNDGTAGFNPAGAGGVWTSDDENPQITITGTTDNPTAFRVTLTATDATGPATDTLTIKVYDDECAAALGEGEIIDPGDFDADCDTDLADIGAMSAVWDYDYTITAPAIKPF